MTKQFETDEERKAYFRNAKIKSRAKKSGESVEKQVDLVETPVESVETTFESVKTTEQPSKKYQFDSVDEIISFLKLKMQEDESIKRQLIEDTDTERYIIEDVAISREDKDAIFKIHEHRCSTYGFKSDVLNEFDVKYFLHTDKKKEYFSIFYIRYKNGYGYYTPDDGIKFTTDINAIISQYKIFPKYKNLIQNWLE